jgi:hypothetical protein
MHWAQTLNSCLRLCRSRAAPGVSAKQPPTVAWQVASFFKSHGPWPPNSKSPKGSVQRPSQDHVQCGHGPSSAVCEIICDRDLNQKLFEWISILSCPHTRFNVIYQMVVRVVWKVLRAALHLEAGSISMRLITWNFSLFWVGGQPQVHIIIRL